MTPLSVRLDPDVRKFYDDLAERESLKTTQKLRSILSVLARVRMGSLKRPVAPPIEAQAEEFEFLLAAEDPTPREDDK